MCIVKRIPDDGQRNCPKHVEFHSKNKFEKLVHLVGFIIRNLSRCTVTWTSKNKTLYFRQFYLCQAKNFASIKLSSNCHKLQLYYKPIFNLHTFTLTSFQYCNRPICKFSWVAPQLVADAKLTLRRIMSYIYIYIERIFLMFLDHTQRRGTVGRTPLDEWSARRRDLYLTTHDTHNRQISMPPVGFEPTISAGERPQAV